MLLSESPPLRMPDRLREIERTASVFDSCFCQESDQLRQAIPYLLTRLKAAEAVCAVAEFLTKKVTKHFQGVPDEVLDAGSVVNDALTSWQQTRDAKD